MSALTRACAPGSTGHHRDGRGPPGLDRHALAAARARAHALETIGGCVRTRQEQRRAAQSTQLMVPLRASRVSNRVILTMTWKISWTAVVTS